MFRYSTNSSAPGIKESTRYLLSSNKHWLNYYPEHPEISYTIISPVLPILINIKFPIFQYNLFVSTRLYRIDSLFTRLDCFVVKKYTQSPKIGKKFYYCILNSNLKEFIKFPHFSVFFSHLSSFLLFAFFHNLLIFSAFSVFSFLTSREYDYFEIFPGGNYPLRGLSLLMLPNELQDIIRI